MVVEEEDCTQDVMAIEGPPLQTTEDEFIDEGDKQSEKKLEFLYADNQTRQLRRLPPRLQ